MIKAIETRYAGCRFRSRLEARWAVLFDHLDIPWEYEPEGFELPSGRYLPDFRITSLVDGERMWVEIKGTPPSAGEISLIRELAMQDHKWAWIVWGDIPRSIDHGSSLGFRYDGWGGTVVPPAIMLTPVEIVDSTVIDAVSQTLDPAFQAARSARFEHGDSPQHRP